MKGAMKINAKKEKKIISDNARKAYKDQNGRWKDEHGHLAGYEVHGDSHN